MAKSRVHTLHVRYRHGSHKWREEIKVTARDLHEARELIATEAARNGWTVIGLVAHND